MAKEQKKQNKNDQKNLFGWSGFYVRAFVLVLVGFIFYSNTLSNEYALDDGIVIEKNQYVQHGIGGIKKIMSTDAYESFYKQMNASQQLSGGRYRPLSLVTFAIEQSLFGSSAKVKPHADVASIRHFVNVALYVFSVVALFYFLFFFLFKEQPEVAFLTALIFLIHPLHTEVIANVKSRDEILSFLFIVLTFISVFRYWEQKRTGQLVWGLFFYFMALLSKEYAISLVVLIPLLIYLKKEVSIQEALMKTIPYGAVAFVYLLIRFSVVGANSVENTDVLNNPYMYATLSEKWGTKIFMLDRYLRLLFYPHPLSSDYSYNTYPYVPLMDLRVLASVLIHTVMVALFFIFFFKRNIISFAIAFYLIHLFMVSNLVMDIGATMGERLVYHSSLGFAMVIAIGINWVLEKINEEKMRTGLVITLSAVLIVPCGSIVRSRNADWKNDNTLFIKDAETVPNSALVNGNAGKAWIDLSEMPENKAHEKEYVLKSVYYLNRSVTIHKLYVNGYLNLGVAYFKLKDYDKAKENWDKVKSIFPNNPYLKRNFPLLGVAYMNEALSIGGKEPGKAIGLLRKGTLADPANADIWYNLGGASYTTGNFAAAREAWTRTIQINPNYEQAKQGLKAIEGK